MRHRLKRKKLNMDYDRRRAVIKALLRTLLTEGKVETTLARGRYLLSLAEKTITKIRQKDLNAKRTLFKLFQDQARVNQVVDRLSEQLPKRRGGFLRLRKIKRRRGDNAVVVRIEFVDKIDLTRTQKKEKKEGKNGKERRKKSD